MEEIILKPKGKNKKLTKIKKQIIEARKNETSEEEMIPESSKSEKTSEFDQIVLKFLKKLKFFQDRAHKNNPIKAHSKRRLIYGIKEILKHLKAEGINIVFVAKDFEIFKDCSTDLTNNLEEIIEECNRRNIPVIHASTRSKFSHHLNKPGSISIIGVVDYSGAEELYNEMMKKKEQSDGNLLGNVEDTDV